MKLLLVLGSDETYGQIVRSINLQNYELIRYRQVVKAMDNMTEIDPQAIIVSARDFPRHWKVLVQFVRSYRTKAECSIIVLEGEGFPPEEGQKAVFLGINGLVKESLDDQAEMDRLEGILKRQTLTQHEHKNHPIHVEPWHRFGFLMLNPASNVIVNGELQTLSPEGISFIPAKADVLNDVEVDAELDECSLRAGDDILSPVCKMLRNDSIVSLEFVSFPEGEDVILQHYMEIIARRKPVAAE